MLKPPRAVVLGAVIATAAAVFPFAGTAAHADTEGVTVTGQLPAAIGVGADPVQFTGSAENGTDADLSNARYDFNIDTAGDPDLMPSDVTISYSIDGGTTFVPAEMGSNGAGNISAHTPDGGFAFPATDSQAPVFEVALAAGAPTGTISTELDLDQVDPDTAAFITTLASATSTSDIDAAPAVTAVSPTSGSQSGGTPIAISGSGFTDATSVDVGGAPATQVDVVSDTSITATTPSGAVGSADVTVTGPAGTSATSAADTFTYTEDAPTVTSVDPASGTQDGGTPVTITGTGLSDATAVDFGSGNPGIITASSATSITVTSPAGAVGDVDVTVTGPGGTSATSTADTFTYTEDAPTVTSVDPAGGTQDGGTSVTITGTGFTGATAVSFGTTAATTYQIASDTSITATAPAGEVGTVDVTVTNPEGSSPDVTGDQFTYTSGAPTVTSIAPTSGTQDGGTPVTITGTGLSEATEVDFGDVAASGPITVNSATSITVSSPAGDVGTVDVTVTNPDGTSADVTGDQFTYTSGAPTVASIAPNGGTQDGGTSVTITGTNFTGATAVTFGTTAATDVTVHSSTSITATSPAGAVGAVDVTVTNPDGTSADVAGDRFTYASDAPTVTAISPSTGYTTGGTRVTITGTNFMPGSDSVDFRSDYEISSADIVSETATQIVVLSPQEETGVFDVVVSTNHGASSETSKDQFTYLATVPVIAVQGKGTSAMFVSTSNRPFVNYGGAIIGAPSIVSANDRNYYFVRGGNHALFVRTDKTLFTALQTGTPVYCNTAPAAMLGPDDTFVVGCVSKTGVLLTATGTLPTTGNPRVTGFTTTTLGGFNDDTTTVAGGISSDGDGDFIVTGKAYPAAAQTENAEPNAAGNTYAVPVGNVETLNAHETVAPEFKIGGTCGGAPSVAFSGEVGNGGFAYYVTCRGTTSAVTTAYEMVESENPRTNVDQIVSYAVRVGGLSLGSPVTMSDASGDGIDILTTGLGGPLYEAKVADNHTTTGYVLDPLYARSGSGPAISSGPPPAATSMARREFGQH